MARFSESYQAVDEEYRSLAALPLPEAAVVLDVRQRDDDGVPLLSHLNTELADLAAEMRVHHVSHWAALSDCVALLRLDAIPVDQVSGQETHYRFAPSGGEEQVVWEQEHLASVLGSLYIDQVRNARLKAPAISPSTNAAVKQSTVRIFLLADMREMDSLIRAATYAHWFKAWSEREQGPGRRHRNEYLHTVILCLHAGASYQDALLQTLGQLPESAVDTVIMLQKYDDAGAAISDTAQLVKAELLLYALLLRWPDVLWKRIDDSVEHHPRFLDTAQTLPWPTYLVGLAAFEYSARWSARWLDYSVTSGILKTLNNEEAIEQEQSLLVSTIHKWLDAWQCDLQSVVPGMLVVRVEELQGMADLQGLVRQAGLSRGNLLDAHRKLDLLREKASDLYTGAENATLQIALERGPRAVLDQLRWRTERVEQSKLGEASEPVELDEPYLRLLALKRQLQRFLGIHFKDAEGAVPRGLAQLATFQKYAEQTLVAPAKRPVKLDELYRQFEQDVQGAGDQIAAKVKTWRLPFAGTVLRSTVISLIVVIVMSLILLFAIDWRTVFAGLPFSTPVLLWVARALIALLALAGECLYLARRNRLLRRLYRQIEAHLTTTTGRHLAIVDEAISARIGLELVKLADLYTADNITSPYEDRLQAFARTCRRAQETALRQRNLAEARLDIDSQDDEPPPAWAVPEDGQARVEFIKWSHIEETFLATFKALPSDPMLNLLVEMLLRQLGTERPQATLEDVWQQQRWIEGRDKEARFQLLNALLVAHLLVAPLAPPSRAHLADILSAMQEYIPLKERYIEDRTMPAGDAVELEAVVKSALQAQARGRQPMLAFRDGEQQSMNALVSWVNAQHEHIPQLQEIFASNDLLEQLMLPLRDADTQCRGEASLHRGISPSARLQPSRVLSDLYGMGTLLGRPDEISGEDVHYLFAPQGNQIAYSMFIEALNNINEQRVEVMAFPDREKLIYLRIHRALQFFSEEDGAVSEAHQDGSDTRSAATLDGEPVHPKG